MQAENTNIPNSEVRPDVAVNSPAPSLDRLPPLPSVEAGLNTGAERVEQVGELRAAQADATSAAVPVAQVAQPSVVDDTTGATTTTTPVVAANDELIEKAWVDRAKEIVAKTAGDPHAREEQVSALKHDYQQKRFGRGVGTAS